MPHTKGQWKVKEIESPTGSHFKVVTESETVCNVITRHYERAIANSNLIAATPDMLEALQAISDCQLRPDYHSDRKLIEFCIETAKKAINKAT